MVMDQGAAAVLDRQWMDRELNDARLARRDAEAAQEDVEEMLRELQGIRLGHQGVVFSILGVEQAADAAT
jgi:hypothetical protein